MLAVYIVIKYINLSRTQFHIQHRKKRLEVNRHMHATARSSCMVYFKIMWFSPIDTCFFIQKVVQSKSGFFATGFFCLTGFFCPLSGAWCFFDHLMYQSYRGFLLPGFFALSGFFAPSTMQNSQFLCVFTRVFLPPLIL